MPSAYLYISIHVWIRALRAPRRLDGYHLHSEPKRLASIAHWSVNRKTDGPLKQNCFPENGFNFFDWISVVYGDNNLKYGAGITTDYGLDGKGVGVRVLVRIRLSSSLPHISPALALGHSKPPIQCVPGALSLGVKRQGRQADHSPPPNAEIKKTWSIHPLPPPPYVFMA
jgi:hypothetical protein